MTRDEIKTAVLAALTDIAPEVTPDQIRGNLPLREQLDLDSMDFLNFIIGLDKRLRVAIPETDYTKIATLDSCVEYLFNSLSRASK
jgi:acyl carrier protein